MGDENIEMKARVKGEFFFSIIKAIGTDAQTVIDPLNHALERVDYRLHPMKLSERLSMAELSPLLGTAAPSDPYERYRDLMNAGDQLRIESGRADALAMEAIHHLHTFERSRARDACTEVYEDDRKHEYRGIGYLFHSLMHPAEADRLYTLYGSRHIAIAAYSPEAHRDHALRLRLARGDGQRATSRSEQAAELLRRDAGQLSVAELRRRDTVRHRKMLINVRGTFPRADLFVDVRDPDGCSKAIDRLVDLLFGHPFHTQTVDEIGMGAAYAAQLQSGNVARPVGAAILTPDGEVLATGTNDVPRAGGGIYRADRLPDHRDFKAPWGVDSSDRIRRGIFHDLLESLILDADWLSALDSFAGTLHVPQPGMQLALALRAAVEQASSNGDDLGRLDMDALVDNCLRSPLISHSEVFDVIEYSRGLHAEMDAITTAARIGVSIRDSTLYTTTFPCHECARLIIGAGISRVVFIEPYEKSRVADLYSSEIQFDGHPEDRTTTDKVVFAPYVGIAPNRFPELFSWVDRKADDYRGERRMDGALFDWQGQAKTGKVRRTIITNDALYSAERADDLARHESTVIKEYLSDVRKSREAKTRAQQGSLFI